jgi:hypothetical protein
MPKRMRSVLLMLGCSRYSASSFQVGRALKVERWRREWYEGEINATLLQARHGKGRLIASTSDLLQNCADDPVATIMLNDLIIYAASDFRPAHEAVQPSDGTGSPS